uniref:C2H2-type domain-containing protein n=1 Tax=Timema tahoe TaxID=61484 RepID=A0A7R9IJC7_9NEOP|nr:unnamed protein product [Timema tahoe]
MEEGVMPDIELGDVIYPELIMKVEVSDKDSMTSTPEAVSNWDIVWKDDGHAEIVLKQEVINDDIRESDTLAATIHLLSEDFDISLSTFSSNGDESSASLIDPVSSEVFQDKVHRVNNPHKVKGPAKTRQLHISPRKFSCAICNKSYMSKRGLKEHQMKHSGLRPFSCDQCGRSFTTRRLLCSHKLVHAAVRSAVQCGTCHKTYLSAQALRTHQQIHTGRLREHCPVCEATFTQRGSLQRHMMSHGEGGYPCPHCNKRYSRNDKLQDHLRFHNGDTRVRCRFCRAYFPDHEARKQHYIDKPGHVRQENVQVFECQDCGKKIRGKRNYETHVLNHRGEKNFLCDTCGQRFVSSKLLKSHQVTHATRSPVECPLCEKSFCHKTSLRTHLRIHRGVKMFKCHLCEKAFSQNCTLRKHMLLHLGKPIHKYECHICSKGFLGLDKMKRHMIVHTGERPVQCELCQRSFADKKSLKTHMLAHTGEMPYECDDCGRKFRQRGNLIKHIQLHAGELPFECHVCKHRFSRKDKLKLHEGTHQGLRPYPCPVCGRGFTQSGSRKLHLRLHSARDLRRYGLIKTSNGSGVWGCVRWCDDLYGKWHHSVHLRFYYGPQTRAESEHHILRLTRKIWNRDLPNDAAVKLRAVRCVLSGTRASEAADCSIFTVEEPQISKIEFLDLCSWKVAQTSLRLSMTFWLS